MIYLLIVCARHFPAVSSALLPVTIEPNTVAEQPLSREAPMGCLTLEAGRLRVRIEGRPDAATLRLVLAELRRP